MCPLTWQDHFNLYKKGMTPVDMPSLHMSLEAVEHGCTQEKSNAKSNKKASNKRKKGNKRPGTESTIRVPKKVCFEKDYGLHKKHGGMYTMYNTKNCHKYEKDGSEKKPISVPLKKVERNQILQRTLLHT
jgi:hypothetical protein